jgi:hypothetical protein
MPRIQTPGFITGGILSSIPSASCSITPSSISLIQLHLLSYNSPCISCSRRRFSSSPIRETRLRAQFWAWLTSEGASLRSHVPGRTNYLTNLRNRNEASKSSGVSPDGALSAEDVSEDLTTQRPFPLNPFFTSEPILSEGFRDAIYERVAVQKKSVRSVSVDFGVDMRRVGAVVRLVELEKRWKEQVKFFHFPPFFSLLD